MSSQRPLGARFRRLWMAVLLTGLGCVPRQTPHPTTANASSGAASAPVPAALPPSSEEALALPSLSEHFAGKLSLGVAAEPYLLHEQGPVIAKHFKRLVTENAMKWGAICRIENHCDWKKADAVADFARQHGMKMTGHTFVWHQMYPAWLFNDSNGKGNASKALLTERLRKHIFQMVEHYADVVDNWDVVNEAISDKPGRIWRQLPEQSKWYEAFGSEEYVELAFRIAAEAVAKFAPNTKLYYNDYCLENEDKRKKALEAIRGLRQRGVRIDGVGIQGHIHLGWPAREQIERAIEEIAAEGLLVKISELDISIYTEDDLDNKRYQKELSFDPALDVRLAQRYGEVFEVFLAHAAQITSVTFWGLSDDHSWLNGWPIGRRNFPLLLDRTHRPKLAMRRLLEL